MGAQDDTLLDQEEQLMASHSITLTATFDAPSRTINIAGDNSRKRLDRGSGSHVFRFRLDDQSGHNVQFAALRAADNSGCPPSANPNTQIDQVRMDNASSPRTARFRDKNDNKPAMDVAYEWTFTCDDPSIRVSSFDPIISNGGRV